MSPWSLITWPRLQQQGTRTLHLTETKEVCWAKKIYVLEKMGRSGDWKLKISLVWSFLNSFFLVIFFFQKSNNLKPHNLWKAKFVPLSCAPAQLYERERKKENFLYLLQLYFQFCLLISLSLSISLIRYSSIACRVQVVTNKWAGSWCKVNACGKEY